ncbi:hypothetical protein DYB30_009978, partial [Aphanomyces astaci]
ANPGRAATPNSPFPFVQYPSNVYEQLAWVAKQNSSESNLQGVYVADLVQNKVERLSSGQPVDNTDVLGRPSTGVHSTKKH